MLYDRSENEAAIEDFFLSQESTASPPALTIPLIFIIHFSMRDLRMLRESVQTEFSHFLPPNWYQMEFVEEVAKRLENCNSLGDVLRRMLAQASGAVIIPVLAADFFMMVRQRVFTATEGELHFNVLGRRKAHELAAANFVEVRDFEGQPLMKLGDEDFAWLFQECFLLSQQRGVITSYLDARYGGHYTSTFDNWRKDAGTFFSKFFQQARINTPVQPAGSSESQERIETERKISGWFTEKLALQIDDWTVRGWPLVERSDPGDPDDPDERRDLDDAPRANAN